MNLRYIDIGTTKKTGKVDRINSLSLWTDLTTPVIVRAFIESDSVHIVANEHNRDWFVRNDSLTDVEVNFIPCYSNMRESLFVAGKGSMCMALAFRKFSLFNSIKEGQLVRHAFNMALSETLPQAISNEYECTYSIETARFVGYTIRAFSHVIAFTRPNDLLLYDKTVADGYKESRNLIGKKAEDIMISLDSLLDGETLDSFTLRLLQNFARQLGLDAVEISKETMEENERLDTLRKEGIDFSKVHSSYLSYTDKETTWQE